MSTSEQQRADENAALTVWHDEADRMVAWGTLDPSDACMCRDCVLPGDPS